MYTDAHDNAVTAVTACKTYEPASVRAAIEAQFSLLGGVGRFVRAGQRVLIKPNLIVPKPPEVPAKTHPEVIYAVSAIVKDAGAEPIVADSPAWSTTRGCLKAMGIIERLEKLGAEIANLDRPERMRIEDTPVGLSRVALKADVIINLPKLKAHQQLTATFAFKNLYGCVCGLGGKEKAYWHFARGKEFEPFCRMVVGIYQKLKPALNIIDGIIGMEGQGPINGTPKPVGYLVAGTDPAACERVCCDLVGFDPQDLPLLRTADKMGVGLPLNTPFEIVGDSFETPACPVFAAAKLTPLRFSFPHICKSITKQAGLLLKGLFS